MMAAEKAPACCTSRWLREHLPRAAVVASLGGSAVATQLLPAAGLLPGGLSAELTGAYDGFAAVPGVSALTKPLALGGRALMLVLATFHLLAAAALAFQSRRRLTQAAGAWAMIAMVGAEYCTRRSGFVPPGVPERLAWAAACLGTLVHAALFACGLCLCLRPPAVSLLRQAREAVAAALERRRAAKGAAAGAGRPAEAGRGRPAEAGRRQRDSTPVPKAKEQDPSAGNVPETAAKAEKLPAGGQRQRGAVARGAAALVGTN